MNQYVRLPDPLCKTEDMVQNWRKWKNDFVVFMKASNNINAPMKTKVFLLQNYIGKFGQNIIERIMSKNLECKNNVDMLLLELDKHFDPPKNNEIIERYIFFTAYKERNKSFNEYVDFLKEKAANCNFGTMRDSLIRDKIIAELKDEQLIKKLTIVENVDLLTLASICRSHALEVEKKKQALLTNNVNKCKPNIEGNKHTHPKITHTRNCRRCNQRHPLKACPAWGNKCKCGQYNHYSSCCPNNMISEKREEESNVNLQQENLQGPSAPPLSAIDKEETLYPSLNDMASGDKTSASSWTWYKERDAKVNENFQKSPMTFQEEETKKPSNIADSNNNCCIS